jgi:hypothetical protein
MARNVCRSDAYCSMLQKQIIECEIRELRTKINNHLDKLQEDLMKELTEAETKINKTMKIPHYKRNKTKTSH